MTWVRIHDGALSHPKIVGIFNWRDPLHVWFWGLSHCQAHLTNGRILTVAVPKMGRKAAGELVTRGLWAVTADGWQVHDYLDWNDSRDLITKKRTEAKDRMRAARDRSVSVLPPVHANASENFAPRSREVLRGVGKSSDLSSTRDPERESEGKPPADDTERLELRAGEFVTRYGELYVLHRYGAKFRQRPVLDWQDAQSLCALWDDARLEKLAIVFLETDDPWISTTDRSFKIFAMKATWADAKLTEWERTHGVTV